MTVLEFPLTFGKAKPLKVNNESVISVRSFEDQFLTILTEKDIQRLTEYIKQAK